MSDSILTNTKKILGLDDSYTAFDTDIITFINAVFSTIQQLGVGPTTGFAIVDKTAVWTDFLPADPIKLAYVKTYLALKVKMMFDPSGASYVVSSLENVIKELEWRLNVAREVEIDPVEV